MHYPPRLIAGAIALFCLIVLLVIAFTGQVRAHSWYPVACCSDKDCVALDEDKGQWVREDGQFFVLWDGRRYPKDKAQPSPDGRYHACERPDKTLICFFVPPGST